jgi:hypothetical protein
MHLQRLTVDSTFIYDYSMQFTRDVDMNFERLWLMRYDGKSNYCGYDLDRFAHGHAGCIKSLPPYNCFSLIFTSVRPGK